MIGIGRKGRKQRRSDRKVRRGQKKIKKGVNLYQKGIEDSPEFKDFQKMIEEDRAKIKYQKVATGGPITRKNVYTGGSVRAKLSSGGLVAKPN